MASNGPRLYALAKRAAEDAAGGARAFAIIGARYREALVAQEILQVVYQQDETHVSDAAVRTLLADLYELLRDDASLGGA